MKKQIKRLIICFAVAAIPTLLFAAPQGIENPLRVNNIQCFISEVLRIAVNILAIVGVLYILWSGFLFVKAQGNEKALEEAKKSIMNAVIGMAIILGAWVFATIIANTVSKVTTQDVNLPSSSSCTSN